VSDPSQEGTAALSRDHTLVISESGLVTITGGKWTTYRKMAEDTIDQAATLGGLEDRPSVTRELPIHGHDPRADEYGLLADYGADAPFLETLMEEDPRFGEPVHPSADVQVGQVIWGVRCEAARTVEDVLARRTRMLLLDARASVAMAPAVAKWMALELGRDDAWQRTQVDEFSALAENYLVSEEDFPVHPT
jgi:glycerol-3-phosphate dehydrogenase